VLRGAISSNASAVEEDVSHRRWLTAGLTLGIFVAALETTVVTAAMPRVVASLGGLSHYSWVFSAFLIAMTVSLPLWGKLADLYGRRPFYLLGLGVFLLGSALAGQARSMGQLIAFRGLQGVGAGAVQPLGLTIASDIYPLPERARKQALFSGVWGIATLIGPVLGGVVVEYLSWRWVFYLSLPFGLGAAFLVGRHLPEESKTWERDRSGAFDLFGAFAFASTAIWLLWLVNEGRMSLPLLGGGLLSMAGLLWAEHSARDPVLPLRFFRDPVLRAALGGGFLTNLALFGATAFISLLLQAVLGADPVRAGSALVPLFAAWVIFSIFASRMLLRVGFRAVILLGAALLALGLMGLSQRQVPLSDIRLFVLLTLVGAGMGLCNVSHLLLVQHRVSFSERGRVTALLFLLRTLGGAIGTSLLGETMRWRIRVRAAPHLERLLIQDPDFLLHPSQPGITPEALLAARHIMGAALQEAFWIAAFAALAAFLLSFALPCTESPAHPSHSLWLKDPSHQHSLGEESS